MQLYLNSLQILEKRITEYRGEEVTSKEEPHQIWIARVFGNMAKKFYNLCHYIIYQENVFANHLYYKVSTTAILSLDLLMTLHY